MILERIKRIQHERNTEASLSQAMPITICRNTNKLYEIHPLTLYHTGYFEQQNSNYAMFTN